VRVGQHLDLDVARMLEIFLEVHRGAANATCASARVMVHALSSAASVWTTRNSAPAAAAGALMITGYPTLRATRRSPSHPRAAAVGIPGTVGTPALAMACLALTLSPIA